jgi:hypothetical protein
MPHMAGYCTCGLRMHWPRDIRYGDEWECYRCGKVWTWSRNGTNPMASTRSRAPAPTPQVVVLPVVRERSGSCPRRTKRICSSRRDGNSPRHPARNRSPQWVASRRSWR